MFVVTVGTPGNVKPKFTDAVDAFSVVNDMRTVPRRVQFVRFVIDVLFAAIAAVFAVMFAVLTLLFVSTEASAVST